MQPVESGVDHWLEALRAIATSPEKCKIMRAAAISYSRDHLASWEDVLAEDLFAVWRKAANEKQKQVA
jgi:hypothetical protein